MSSYFLKNINNLEAFAKDSINISDSELIFQKIIGKG